LRFFIFCCLVVFAGFSDASCPHVSWDETVFVKHIIDGDTVTLIDGRRVRFIGIDTPEMNASDGHIAKKQLERYVSKGDKLHLVFDKSRHDKYGRMLAYVYSKTGRNLALMQLQKGFARHWVIGKNDKFWKCFQTAERQARRRKKGIWSKFRPVKAANLNKSKAGYQYVSGVITQLKRTSKDVRFVLDKKLSVKIRKVNFIKFKENNIYFRMHQRVLLQGKIVMSRGKAKLTLYHPAQFLQN